MAILALALRTYVRYVVPLTMLSALVFAPLLGFVGNAPAPIDGAAARSLLVLTWIVTSTAWIAQLALVGAAAPAVRAVAGGEAVSQLRMLRRGGASLGRMIVPVGVAVAAILVGGLALVIPGVLLVGLLALTGASTEAGVPAPLVDSIAVVRKNIRVVALTLVAILVVDFAITGGAYLVLVEPLTKKPTPAQLDDARDLIRCVTLGLVVVSPLAAAVLAAIRVKRAPPG